MAGLIPVHQIEAEALVVAWLTGALVDVDLAVPAGEPRQAVADVQVHVVVT